MVSRISNGVGMSPSCIPSCVYFWWKPGAAAANGAFAAVCTAPSSGWGVGPRQRHRVNSKESSWQRKTGNLGPPGLREKMVCSKAQSMGSRGTPTICFSSCLSSVFPVSGVPFSVRNYFCCCPCAPWPAFSSRKQEPGRLSGFPLYLGHTWKSGHSPFFSFYRGNRK